MALDRLKDEYGAENVAVHIVDTKLPATPLNMLVWEAVRQREKGMPLEQMIAWATEAHNYMHIHFMVDDLKALARGGRIPSALPWWGRSSISSRCSRSLSMVSLN